MLHKLFVLTLLAFASASDDAKHPKRSLSSFGYPSLNSLSGHTWPSHYPWQTFPLAQGSLHPFSTYPDKFNLGASASHEIAAAVAAAKEAMAAAALAHQKVQAAREQAIIQEKVAAAKEAAARAAIQRSEAAAQVAAAIQKSEALAAAAAAVHKSVAVAAHAAGHLPAGPWIHSKPAIGHWG